MAKKIASKYLDFSAAYEQETPSGTIDGVNTTFTLSSTPQSNKSVLVYIDGSVIPQVVGASGYQISGTTITMGTAPALGQSIYAFYAL